MQFDQIPFDDIKGDWHKLGQGSFGNVYKGTYLGTDVAIKEVLPSSDYDVRKYFEREWKLMREARHPNVVLFLGLSPAPDGRVFIVTEFIENGNLRQYLFAKSKPFPWRLRLSFCIDIARALAYLHARNCVHRDIKGENLLLTSNGRLKITDFGFARITPRSEEEAKRLTFCGTDAYMSPEILIGEEFGLPTDVFSLGIIFCEIICRKVADDHTFKRAAPTYSLDPSEVYQLASPGCPPELIHLALDCCAPLPADRPSMVSVLARLSSIEETVLRSEAEQEPVGTVRFFTASGSSRRPRIAPRIPSFGMGVGKEMSSFDVEIPASVSPVDVPATPPAADEEEEGTESEGDPDVVLYNGANVKRTPSWAAYGSVLLGGSSMLDNDSWSQADVIPSEANSTAKLIGHEAEPSAHAEHGHDDTGSTMTVRASTGTVRISPIVTTGPSAANGGAGDRAEATVERRYVSAGVQSPTPPAHPGGSNMSLASYHTAPVEDTAGSASASAISHASSRVPVHRFTLIKSAGAGKSLMSSTTSPSGPSGGTSSPSAWSPFGFFFSNIGFPVPGGGSAPKASKASAKCDLCGRRMGWRGAAAAVLECDDCGMRCHVRCGEAAPSDCGVRFPKVGPALPGAGAGASAAVGVKAGGNGAGKQRLSMSAPSSPAPKRRSPRMGVLGL